MSDGAGRLTVMGLKFGPDTCMARLDRDWAGLATLVRAERPDLLALQGCSVWARLPWAVEQAESDFELTPLVADSNVDRNTVLCYRSDRLDRLEWDATEGVRTFYGFGIGVFEHQRTGRRFAAASVDLSPWTPESAERDARLIGDLAGGGECDAIITGEFGRLHEREPVGSSTASGWPGCAGLTDVGTYTGGDESTWAETGNGAVRGNCTYVTSGLVPGIVEYRELLTGRHTVTKCVVDLARTA